MRKSAKGKDGKKATGPRQLRLHLPGMVRAALYDTVIGALGLRGRSPGKGTGGAVRRTLRTSGRTSSIACGPRREFAVAGRPAGRGATAAGAQCCRSRAQLAELAGMERTRARSANGSFTAPSANWPN